MEGVRDLDLVYAFYREPDHVLHGGPEMVRFLDSVADILRAKRVYLGTSHMRLSLSRAATYPESSQQPYIMVFADGRYVNLSYHERWEEGDLVRTREEGIRCPAGQARAALLELLARLKPARAEPGAAADGPRL